MVKNTNHVMVDVECLSLRPDAVILSIGAVQFNPWHIDDWASLSLPSRSFYSALPMEIQIEEFGGHISAYTLAWWFRQLPDAQSVFEETTKIKNHHLHERLLAFTQFTGTTLDGLWATPSHFDYPKLDWLFDKCGIQFPCPYYRIHCGMSLKQLADPNGDRLEVYVPPGFTTHNALDDAKKQALQVQQCLRLLKS